MPFAAVSIRKTPKDIETINRLAHDLGGVETNILSTDGAVLIQYRFAGREHANKFLSRAVKQGALTL